MAFSKISLKSFYLEHNLFGECMENLKEKFEKLYSKYKDKKNFFEKIIKKWQRKNKTDLYKQANDLLHQADNYSKQLAEGFIATVESQPDKVLQEKMFKDFKKVYKQLNSITKPEWRQWIEAIIFVGGLVFILRTYAFGLYHVPTGSAEPNILVGDRIWGNKFIYNIKKIKRGDLVIFDNPEFFYNKSNIIDYYWQKYIGFPIPLLGLSSGPDNWVKRVIAIPGDTIEGKIEDGKTTIYLNGKKLDETKYVNPYPLIRLKKSTGLIDLDSFGPFRIPGFLRKQENIVRYTYVPEKDLKNQPYYSIEKDEIVRKPDGNYILSLPYTPTYESGYFYQEIANSVDSFGPITLPEGKFWAMGDSRKNSRDSRYWGFLDENLIHGRASFVIFSVDSQEPFWLFEFIKHPIKFWTNFLRWDRFFKKLNNLKIESYKSNQEALDAKK